MERQFAVEMDHIEFLGVEDLLEKKILRYALVKLIDTT